MAHNIGIGATAAEAARGADPSSASRAPPLGTTPARGPPVGTAAPRAPPAATGALNPELLNQSGNQRGRSREVAGWDDADFLRRITEARASGDDKAVRQCLREVSKSNYQLVQGLFSKDVAKTVWVSRDEGRQRVQGLGRDPEFTFSNLTTGDALLEYAARDPDRAVCALNFANGEQVGGGYLNGARAQEEELCRQFPCLYTSLSRAKDFGKAYPFGPCTYPAGSRDPARYSDVLFTPRVVARRHSQANGYKLMSEREVCDNICLVSAAAPNLKQGKECWEPRYVLEAVKHILVVPKLKERETTRRSIGTLILGAWGCGAFGCDPAEMAKLFAQALIDEKLGRLYKEVHFAIPAGADQNADIFEATLRSCRVPLVRIDGAAGTSNGAGAAAPPVASAGAAAPTGSRATEQRPPVASGQPGRGGFFRGAAGGAAPAAGMPTGSRRQ